MVVQGVFWGRISLKLAHIDELTNKRKRAARRERKRV